MNPRSLQGWLASLTTPCKQCFDETDLRRKVVEVLPVPKTNNHLRPSVLAAAFFVDVSACVSRVCFLDGAAAQPQRALVSQCAQHQAGRLVHKRKRTCNLRHIYTDCALKHCVNCFLAARVLRPCRRFGIFPREASACLSTCQCISPDEFILTHAQIEIDNLVGRLGMGGQISTCLVLAEVRRLQTASRTVLDCE